MTQQLEDEEFEERIIIESLCTQPLRSLWTPIVLKNKQWAGITFLM
jgi:hypothetical protein